MDNVGLIGVNSNGLISTSHVIAMIDPRSTPVGEVVRSTGRGKVLVSTAINEGAGAMVIASDSRVVLYCLPIRGLTDEVKSATFRVFGRSRSRWEQDVCGYQAFERQRKRCFGETFWGVSECGIFGFICCAASTY